MACLAAGEVPMPAREVLANGVDDVLALPDQAAEETVRVLVSGIDGDPPPVSGEPGCVAGAGSYQHVVGPPAETVDAVASRGSPLGGNAWWAFEFCKSTA